MRLDNLIIRLTAVMGGDWLQAYALINLKDGVDIDKFRMEMPRRLTYHHETEKYLGGSPGDLFVGFFAKGQMQLFEELSSIKAMAEVREVKDWAIAYFPVKTADMTKLDWQIVKCLRSGAEKDAKVIADELGENAEYVETHLKYIKEIPLAFSIEPPNKNVWSFTELHMDFSGTTYHEVVGDLQKIGKPFGASSAMRQAALMVEPESVEELTESIKKLSTIPGVNFIACTFCEDMIWAQPWLDKFIDERIAEFG